MSRFIYVLKFWMEIWRCARFCRLMCWSRNSHHPGVTARINWNIRKKDLTLQEPINHMRTEEANLFKDKLDSPSLNCSKGNLVESTVPTNRDKFKGELKENRKLSYGLSNRTSSAIRSKNQMACAMSAISRATKHFSVHFAKGNHSQTEACSLGQPCRRRSNHICRVQRSKSSGK